MKLFLFLCVVSSLLINAMTSPLDDYLETMSHEERTGDSQQLLNEGQNNVESLPRDQLQSSEEDMFLQQDMDDADDSSLIMSEDIDEELPAKSVEELKNMLKNKGEGTIQAACYRKRKLQHGNTIALQYSMEKSRWLGCAGHVCLGITCPGMFMSRVDWGKCRGEIYQIYRPLGRGPIRSGDFVGLYNTGSRLWFSMVGNRGHRLPCPGKPTSSTGFAHLYSWFWCGGEVFQIYANGKALYAPIEDHDTIVLYYPAAASYVRFYANKVDVDKCLPTSRRPPNPDTYDKCGRNLVELTIK